MMADSEYLVVLCTVPSAGPGDQAEALALGRALVEEGLAACVQVLPAGTGIYRWQNRLYVDAQVQLLIKTRRSVWPCLRARILALHADDVPEILALPVVDGLAPYLEWIDQVVTAECPPS